jgi:hypothetical protein
MIVGYWTVVACLNWRRHAHAGEAQIQLFVFRVRENFENRQMWHQTAIELGCGFLMSPCLRGR